MQIRLVIPIALLLSGSFACRALTSRGPETRSPSGISSTPHEPIPAEETAAICENLTADILEFAQYGATAAEGLGSATSTDLDVATLVTYDVVGDEIRNPDAESVPEYWIDERDDTQAQREVWNYFAALVPAEQRSLLAAYVIIADGPDNVLGAVSQTNTPEQWALEIDIEDAANPFDLTYTLLHEFGHLLTLNASQVELSEAIFQNPDDTRIYDNEAAACPRYFPGEGCSRPDSYLDEFFRNFWAGLYDEWLEIDSLEDQTAYEDGLDGFYGKYEDQFVSDYAVTSPAEDIAETWTHFVLDASLEAGNRADEKILYFYSKPELVELRSEILGNLCESFPR